MKLQLHMPGAHRTQDAEHPHHLSWAKRLGKAESASDYLIVGLIVVLGLAMIVGLLTAAGVDY